MSQEIVELSYSRFAQHYSRKNWWANVPLWSTLSDSDKEFWVDFIKAIQSNYGLASKPINIIKNSNETPK